jgi:6-methylsalicylate decarboxylase
MRRYDFHQHLWPEPFIRALERRAEPPRLRGSRLELSVEGSFEVDLGLHELDERLALLDRYELDIAVVSLAPTMETDAHEELRAAYHDGISELADAASGRIVALGAGARPAGFAGACVSAEMFRAGVDPLLGELDRAGGLLFVHPGVPSPAHAGAPSWWASVVDYTGQMQAAYATWRHRDAGRFPGVPIVFAILAGGAPIQLERLRSRDLEASNVPHENGFLDTSSYGRRALELCLSTLGASKLVFGSDAPVIDVGPTFTAVAGLGRAAARTITSDNPARILARETGSHV